LNWPYLYFMPQALLQEGSKIGEIVGNARPAVSSGHRLECAPRNWLSNPEADVTVPVSQAGGLPASVSVFGTGQCPMCRVSSVGVATGYGLDDEGVRL
jgi:hypothetical protein